VPARSFLPASLEVLGGVRFQNSVRDATAARRLASDRRASIAAPCDAMEGARGLAVMRRPARKHPGARPRDAKTTLYHHRATGCTRR